MATQTSASDGLLSWTTGGGLWSAAAPNPAPWSARPVPACAPLLAVLYSSFFSVLHLLSLPCTLQQSRHSSPPPFPLFFARH